MAYPSPGSNSDRNGRHRPGPALERSGRGNSAGGRGLDFAWSKALARAAANSSMAHIAIVEQLDGKAVEWMEKIHRGRALCARERQVPLRRIRFPCLARSMKMSLELMRWALPEGNERLPH
jgi:hypothetical protein